MPKATNNLWSKKTIWNILTLFAIANTSSILIFISQDKIRLNEIYRTIPPQKSFNLEQHIDTADLPQVLQFFHNPSVIFVDIREKGLYDYGHIERAINIPENTLSTISNALLNKLKSAQQVLLYCNGLNCGAVYPAAKILSGKGLRNLKIYAEGWPEWRSCQLPIAMSVQMRTDKLKEAK